jgi:hypothetical protein
MVHPRLARHHFHPLPDLAPIVWSILAIIGIVAVAALLCISQ